MDKFIFGPLMEVYFSQNGLSLAWTERAYSGNGMDAVLPIKIDVDPQRRIPGKSNGMLIVPAVPYAQRRDGVDIFQEFYIFRIFTAFEQNVIRIVPLLKRLTASPWNHALPSLSSPEKGGRSGTVHEIRSVDEIQATVDVEEGRQCDSSSIGNSQLKLNTVLLRR